jgi:putative ATP-dependent endonuclease of the OLD family
MHITKVIIKNYRCLQDTTVELNAGLNILVGDNECGKSTLFEAINLALSGLLNGRPVAMELHPYLFNAKAVSDYITELPGAQPPSILIELYFAPDTALAHLKGQINSCGEDVPGVRLSIEFNQDYRADYALYVAEKELIKTLPVEFYQPIWRGFSGNPIASSRSIPIKPSLIDASTIRNNLAANRYVLDVIKDGLSPKQRVELALSYRRMKDQFKEDATVEEINKSLKEQKGIISEKELSVSLDTTSRASWETGIVPHLDEVPMPLVGKGEQNSVKIKLAMSNSAELHLLLIEEPENHLSFTNLNKLVEFISVNRGSRQLLITTHSSFVLNKLGVNAVLMFTANKNAPLTALTPETLNYFLKLPGHDTLRLILAKRAILVEGPSDELIVQKGYYRLKGKTPLADGVDVITVGALAFKRFLEIAVLLDRQVDVVTDNDGDIHKLKTKYDGYWEKGNIRIHHDSDVSLKTLEPQLVNANGLERVNKVLGTFYEDEASLLAFMEKNKTECALHFFQSPDEWTAPEYIKRAIG